MATTEQRPTPAPTGAPAPRGRSRTGWRSPAFVTLMSAVGLLVLSTLILVWARTRPGFDPYGWLVWGHQAVAGNLNTNAAPSWKPLPYLFTVPYGVFGHYQLWLWMITALAVSLSGSVFAARIAYRLTDAPAGPPMGRLGRRGLRRPGGAGVDRLLALHAERAVGPDDRGAVPGRDRLPPLEALPLGVRARVPGRAGPAGGVAVPRPVRDLGLATGAGDAMDDRRPGSWPWWCCGSGSRRSPRAPPFVAASNALGSGRRLRSDQIVRARSAASSASTRRVLELTAALAVVWALVRRDRVVAGAGGGGGRVGGHRDRVLAARLARARALHVRARGRGRRPGRRGGRAGAGASRRGSRVSVSPIGRGVGLVVVIVIALLPPALNAGPLRAPRHPRSALAHRGDRQADDGRSHASEEPGASGPAASRLTRLEYQTILAWNLHVNVATVGYKYGPAMASEPADRAVHAATRTVAGWSRRCTRRAPGCTSLPG